MSFSSHITGQIATAGGAGTPAVAASTEKSGTPQPRYTIPDILRPQTFGWFAPYEISVTDIAGAEIGMLLRPNPYRVGLLVNVDNAVNMSVRFYVTGGPDTATIFRVAAGSTGGGMLADLFSLCMAGWFYDSPGACRLTVTEFVRRP